jgi:hypothetical protein
MVIAIGRMAVATAISGAMPVRSRGRTRIATEDIGFGKRYLADLCGQQLWGVAGG